MRMWMVEPAIMCRQHLLGEHVELHMMAAHLQRGRRIDKFVTNNCAQPRSIKARHRVLAAEMIRRGYHHASPLDQPPVAAHQHPEARVDATSALQDLLTRCQACSERFPTGAGRSHQQTETAVIKTA